MTQNVVTYTVEIATDNPEGRLLPYMTANVRFEVQRRDSVLHVATAALRWTPAVEQVAPAVRAAAAKPEVVARGEARPAAGDTAAAKEKKPGVVWVAEGSTVRPLAVHTGLANGTVTEIEGPELAEGLVVVTGVDTTAKAASGTTNPFTPKLPKPPKGALPPR